VSLNAVVIAPAANIASATLNTMNLDINDPHQICPSASTYEGRISGGCDRGHSEVEKNSTHNLGVMLSVVKLD
jgi:hypothetical protein